MQQLHHWYLDLKVPFKPLLQLLPALNYLVLQQGLHHYPEEYLKMLILLHPHHLLVWLLPSYFLHQVRQSLHLPSIHLQ
jgi:hypothetical protein